MGIIAQRIIEQRKRLGYTQKKLAMISDTSQKQISNYESGNTIPDTDSLKRLATAFNVSMDYLLGVTEIEAPQSALGLLPIEESALSLFRLLSNDQKEFCVGILRSYIRSLVTS